MTFLNGGNNNLPMSVDEIKKTGNHRGNVSARASSRSFYISRDDKLSFHWTSTYEATTGAVVFSLQNTSSDKQLYITNIDLVSLTTMFWDFYFTQVGDVPAGTTLGALNLNRTGADTADFIAFGNAAVTGVTNTTTSRFLRVATKPHEVHEFDFDSNLILGRNDSFNIQLAGATIGGNGTPFVTVHGVYE